ncbi:hypothetical protein Sste5346_007804 [Sporothrix stenoceras]|uniref:DUF676 domain-containing protein n=1 Tax=Sporothrix stenoceras TaxID=5173 RepID=A0ABR3YS43_9PEZI
MYSFCLVNLDVTRFEVTAVFTHPDAQVDIVLVHGLNGQPKRTWTAKNGLYWPAELLPETLKDCPANILVYGYNADVYNRGTNANPSDNFIYQHAMTLVSHLTAFRRTKGTSDNPIIWIAHSLGGILVKRALLYSNDLRDADHEASRSIYVSTYGIIFLGTPHTGSGLAFWGRVLQGMVTAVPKKFFESEPILIKTLKKNNERLQEINNHFLDIYQRFKIQMVHENHKTDLKGTKAFVVDVDSASPQLPGVTYYGIEADHSNMCKFDGPSAPGYRTMVTSIKEWVKEAPPVIEVRWTVEQEDRVARARREIEERRLTATIRTRSKSNAGGIYWVRAKSISEMEQFFWTIAKNEALKHVVEKALLDVPGASSDSQKELRDPHNVVNIIRAWFGSFDRWLLVFDGIIFNTPGIERFIPDAKNTSIIYTSIQSNVSGRYEFDNPQIMKLDMLSPEDARDLLLTEMERKKPWRQDDRTQALEIVKRMGCLPLMVHAAARHIKATREPLSKYLRTIQNRIRASDLPAYHNVWDELKSRGAFPALNLMNLHTDWYRIR